VIRLIPEMLRGERGVWRSRAAAGDDKRPAGVEEQARLTEDGLDRFASFVADWEREDVRMLTSPLEKLEASKAAIAAQHRPPAGRRWAGPAAD
jgi:hypothetical protein